MATRAITNRGVYGRVIPDIPWLPPSPQKPDEWFAWEEQMMLHRAHIILETMGSDADPEVRANRDREAQRCRRSRTYMIATYGSIYEARPAEEDGYYDSDDPDVDLDPDGDMIPFIPYPFQIFVMEQYYDARRTRGVMGDILTVKARDMGLSNIYGFLVAGDFLCEPKFSARVLSRVEGLVDDTGNTDTLFWKMESFMKGLPQWLMDRLAPGFKWTGFEKNRADMKFTHPVNSNTIIGESSSANAGRGGRATVILYDEAAFMENFGAIWMAGRSSTRHRIAVSTVSTDLGLDFHNLHKGKGGYTSPRVIELHWDEHPLHDEAWLIEERKRDSDEGIKREVLMDYNAGSETDWIYPTTHDMVATHDHGFVPGDGHLYVTMDDGFDDDFAIVWIQYVRATGRFRIFQSYSNQHQRTDFYGSMLVGVPESGFNYDEEATRILRRQRILPSYTPTIDVHFDQVEQMTGMSPYEQFSAKYNIECHMEMNPQNRIHVNRWRRLRELLPYMDFYDTDGAPEVLEALQRYKQRRQREGRESETERKAPIHGKDSHLVTALEWFALAWDEIKYNADAIGVTSGAPPSHNSAQDTTHGYAASPYSGRTPESRPDAGATGDAACPRGFHPCEWKSVRSNSCAFCGLGRTQ